MTNASRCRNNSLCTRWTHVSELHALNKSATNKLHHFNNEPHAIKYRCPPLMTPPHLGGRVVDIGVAAFGGCIPNAYERLQGETEGAGNAWASLAGFHHFIRGFPGSVNSQASTSPSPRRRARPVAFAYPTGCPIACSPGTLIVSSVLFLQSGCRVTAMHHYLCGGDSPVVAGTWRRQVAGTRPCRHNW